MDVFQCVKLSVIKEVFPDELAFMQRHRWDFAEKHSAFLLLLNDDKLSLNHLNQVRQWMAEEDATKVKAATSGANLSGSHRGGY